MTRKPGRTGTVAGVGWPGLAAAFVLILGLGATAAIFFVARANVHNSEHSLARERTSQTLGLIGTVVQQVEAIVAAGAAAAEWLAIAQAFAGGPTETTRAG